jgi:ATP-dependent helicase HepA
MDAIDEFERIIHGVQALRRRMERLACPYQGATGIAAQFYVHQLQTVLRILRDTRVHHLIADEVGLGKTIQSLMVLNAIRLQYGDDFRTVIIVPREEQARQWHEEIQTRAHVVGALDSMNAQTGVRVLWAAKLDKPLEQLHPRYCDFLIVDEIQSLRVDIVDAVVRHANDYPHLLVLTATPDLSSDAKLCQLLKILEPDRVANAIRESKANGSGDDIPESQEDESDADETIDEDTGSEVLQALQRQYESASDHAASNLDLASMPLYQLNSFFAKAWYPFRRLIRSQRRQFPKSLPQRIVQCLTTNPTDAEVRRVELVNSYLRSEIDFGNIDRQALAQRALIGGETLRERVQELIRKGFDPAGDLGDVPSLCNAENGNSRIEELVDWLREFWEHDPKRKVLLTASSNRTIQFLNRQIVMLLPSVGSADVRTDLEVTLLEAANDEKDRTILDVYFDTKIKAFTSGDSQLAIVHDHYSEGYNFQCADAIVFYQIPWNPREIDQWIGRVDRLGRDVTRIEVDVDASVSDGNLTQRNRDRPTSVTIVCIGMGNVFDSELVAVYNQCGVLDSPRVYDPDTSQVMAEWIYSAAVGKDSDALYSVEQVLNLGRESLASGVLDQPDVFGTVHSAVNDFMQLVRSPALEPAISERKFGNFSNSFGRSRGEVEAALTRWLWLLVKQGNYVMFSKDKGNKKYFVFDNTKKGIANLPILDSLSRANYPSIPLFVCRKHIQIPPRSDVSYDWSGAERRKILRFFDHGSDLHEALLDHWIPLGGMTIVERIENEDASELNHQGLGLFLTADSKLKLWNFSLRLKREHLSFDSQLAPGMYLAAIGTHDPARRYRSDELSATAILVGLDDGVNETQKESRKVEVSRHRAGIESDARFVRSTLGVHLLSLAVDRCGKDLSHLVSDLFTFVWTEESRPFCEWLLHPTDLCSQLQTHLHGLLKSRALEYRRLQLGKFRDAICERILLIQVEEHDRLQHIDEQIDAIERRIAEYREFDSERNRDIVNRNLLPKQRLLEERRKLSVRSSEIRVSQLKKCVDEVENPNVDLYVCLVIKIDAIIEPSPTVSPKTEVAQ